MCYEKRNEKGNEKAKHQSMFLGRTIHFSSLPDFSLCSHSLDVCQEISIDYVTLRSWRKC